jgi:hypothetical protein
MYQPWIFGAMLAAGSGLVAMTVTLQRPSEPEPAAPEPAPAAIHVVPPPPPTTVPEPVDSNPVLQIPTIVIQAGEHRAAPVAAPAPPTPRAAERPCSTWRDLGPTHVVAGTPSGELSVRDLCQ